MTPILGLINLLELLTELRKPACFLDYWCITKDIKGYESTADGEIHRMRSPTKGLLS